MKTNQKGFTLLELLVTISAFGIIGVAVVTILVNTLRQANKSNLITTIHENGDAAINAMSRSIREAISLQNPSLPCGSPTSPSSDTNIQATAIDNSAVTYTCTVNSITDSNGKNIIDTSAVTISPNSCKFYCSQTSSSASPVITIQFSLQPVTTSTLVEQTTSPIQFQTSVVMRNITR